MRIYISKETYFNITILHNKILIIICLLGIFLFNINILVSEEITQIAYNIKLKTQNNSKRTPLNYIKKEHNQRKNTGDTINNSLTKIIEMKTPKPFTPTSDLDKLIKTYYDNTTLKPIYDGIISEKDYANAKFKILWILKEPYDNYNGDGGWDTRNDILLKMGSDQCYSKIKTWKTIAYISYGILNGKQYNDITKDSLVYDALKSIAYINVSKYPAETTSPNRDKFFQQIYKEKKEVLLKQIETYNPDIIIAGNVFYLFINDLEISWDEGKAIPEMGKSYFIKNNKLFIDAYHPANTSLDEKTYCDAIISIINENIK